jgi:dCMP deaminase
MIELDDGFGDAYFELYGKKRPLKVLTHVLNYLTELGKNNVDIYSNIVNVFNTSTVLNQTYSEYYVEVVKRITFSDIDRAAFCVVFSHRAATNPKELENFLGNKFVVRDFHKVVSGQSFMDDKSVEALESIKTDDTYDIQLDNPISRDKWFYDIAKVVGSYAKCHSRKIGAVLVRNNSIVSTGYNGPPRGIPTCDQRWFTDKRFIEKYRDYFDEDKTKGVCPRRVIGFESGKGLEVCPAGHAERNALINAARLGVTTLDTKLYMTCGIPCGPCMVEIINAGVEEIVCSAASIYDETSIYLIENSDIKVRLFDFLVKE